MKIYFDESYNQSAFVLALYVASAECWRSFEERWKKILSSEDVECFHMADFESGFAPFDGWEKERRINFMSRLIEAINDIKAPCLSCGVDLEAYNRTFPKGIQRGSVFRYALCFKECFFGLATMAKYERWKEPVAFIFDRNQEVAGFTAELYQKICRIFPKEAWLGTIAFEDRCKFVPLQAADILAYEMMKNLSRKLQDSDRKPRESLRRLDTDKCMVKCFYEEELIEAMEDIQRFLSA